MKPRQQPSGTSWEFFLSTYSLMIKRSTQKYSLRLLRSWRNDINVIVTIKTSTSDHILISVHRKGDHRTLMDCSSSSNLDFLSFDCYLIVPPKNIIRRKTHANDLDITDEVKSCLRYRSVELYYEDYAGSHIEVAKAIHLKGNYVE